MQKLRIATSIFLFAAIIFSCAIATQLFVNYCLWWNCAPSREIVILEDLNIPNYLWPQGSSHGPLNRPSDIFPATEAGITSTYWLEGKVTTYWVRRFPTVDKAKEIYANNLINHTQDYRLDLTIDAEIIADEQFSGCGISSLSGRFHCKILLRYQEYIVSLTSSTDLTFGIADMIDIVKYVDDIFKIEFESSEVFNSNDTWPPVQKFTLFPTG